METLNKDTFVYLLQCMPQIDIARLMCTARWTRDIIRAAINECVLCERPNVKHCARRNHYICLKESFSGELNKAVRYIENRPVDFMNRFFGEAADITKNARNIGRGGHTNIRFGNAIWNNVTTFYEELIKHGNVEKLKSVNYIDSRCTYSGDDCRAAVKSGNMEMINYIYSIYGRGVEDHLLDDAIGLCQINIVEHCIELNPAAKLSFEGFEEHAYRSQKTVKVKKMIDYIAQRKQLGFDELQIMCKYNDSAEIQHVLTYIELSAQMIKDLIKEVVSHDNPKYAIDVQLHDEDNIIVVLSHYFAKYAPANEEIEDIIAAAINDNAWKIAFTCQTELMRRYRKL